MEQKHRNTEDEFLKKYAEGMLIKPGEFDPTIYPQAGIISAAHFFELIPCPEKKEPPEFVYIQHSGSTETRLLLSQWNILWEANWVRPNFFESELPKELLWLKEYQGHNLYILPRDASNNYRANVPLYHLLPYKSLIKFGLPPIRRGLWPYFGNDHVLQSIIPSNFWFIRLKRTEFDG